MKPVHAHDALECKKVFAMLSEFLDQELPADTCEQVQAHIDGCEPCVQFLESLRRSIDLCHQKQPGQNPGPLPESARKQLLALYRDMIARRRDRSLPQP